MTVQLPHRALKAISTPVAGLLYVGVVLPGQWGKDHGLARLAALPMYTYRGKPSGASCWTPSTD